MYGGSSKNVIFKWNFSGTPWGGVWLFPGQTISLMSRPSFCQDFQTPICNKEEPFQTDINDGYWIWKRHELYVKRNTSRFTMDEYAIGYTLSSRRDSIYCCTKKSCYQYLHKINYETISSFFKYLLIHRQRLQDATNQNKVVNKLVTGLEAIFQQGQLY